MIIGSTNSGSRLSTGGLLSMEDFTLFTLKKNVYIIILYINKGKNKCEQGLKLKESRRVEWSKGCSGGLDSERINEQHMAWRMMMMHVGGEYKINWDVVGRLAWRWPWIGEWWWWEMRNSVRRVGIRKRRRRKKKFIKIKNTWYYNVYIHKLKLSINYLD